MIFKILKEYTRRISRNYKIYAISILGMSIAIIASFHIYHFVFKELSVDGFHSKGKDVYRLVNNKDASNLRYTNTPLPLGELLKEKLPEVTNYVRLVPNITVEIWNDEHKLIEEFLYADPSFFEIFDFPLKKGNLNLFKETPNGIVISEVMAAKIFKKEDPIGKSLTVSRYREDEKMNVIVVGVMQNIPETSTIQTDFVVNISINPLSKIDHYKENEWFIQESELFIYAPKLINPVSFSKKITSVVNEKLQTKYKRFDISYYNYEIQRMDDIYLKSTNISQNKKGDFVFLKILVLVILLTLLLATSNYIIMNLGLNLNRAKEFKTRRSLGASKFNIFTQLIIESLLNAAICFVLTILTYPIISKIFTDFIGFEYQLSLIEDSFLLLTYLIVILLIGLIIGTLEFIFSYKLIFIQNRDHQINRSWFSKKFMIIFQLFLFIGLLICILFVKKQINYIESKDLGYDIRNVISVSVYGNTTAEKMKNQIASKSYVKSISRGQGLFRTNFKFWETTVNESKNKIDALMITGDENYLKVHGMELLEGKNLNPLVREDSYKKPNTSIVEVLVNEEFARKLNLKNPVGKMFTNGLVKEAVIIGVFKNVYNAPLYYPLQPIVLGHDFTGHLPSLLQVSYDSFHKKELITEIKKIFINNGIDQQFLDRFIREYNYKDIYKKELQLKRLLEAFTIIVLFISLLGMIAISLFITESKTKEIGIRKVNGATINEIMFMLNKDFIKWVVIAFVMACPIAYYAMSKWLENFAYKTSLSWWVFVLAGLFTLIIALLTVSWQTYRAATRNPVESLRDE